MRSALLVAEDQALDESQMEAALARSLQTALDERLNAAGLRRHPLPPDGDCFFHLLARNGLAATAAEARAEAVTHLELGWHAIAAETRRHDQMQERISRMRAPPLGAVTLGDEIEHVHCANWNTLREQCTE